MNSWTPGTASYCEVGLSHWRQQINWLIEKEFMRKSIVSDWEQLASNANYDAKAFAKLCHESVRQLQRDFRRLFGCTPQEWLNEQRMKAAERRLAAGETVKQVALELGFKQSSHFCRQFKTFYQLTPSQFAASNGDALRCRP